MQNFAGGRLQAGPPHFAQKPANVAADGSAPLGGMQWFGAVRVALEPLHSFTDSFARIIVKDTRSNALVRAPHMVLHCFPAYILIYGVAAQVQTLIFDEVEHGLVLLERGVIGFELLSVSQDGAQVSRQLCIRQYAGIKQRAVCDLVCDELADPLALGK